jgi:hypothetical protein
MLFNDDQELMMKFLNLNYPIQRLRNGRYFKRSILVDRGCYQLSNQDDLFKAYNYLQHVLTLMFSVDVRVTSEVLRVFLNMQ